MHTSEPPAPKRNDIFATATIVLGVAFIIWGRARDWPDISALGWMLAAIGTPFLLWRFFLSLTSVNVVSILLLMRQEKLVTITKDPRRNKKLITDAFVDWARRNEPGVMRVKGVTLNLLFSNRSGILKNLIAEDGIRRGDQRKIHALLLNPYSTTAITRAIQEGRDFDFEDTSPIRSICSHTLEEHKNHDMYRDFETSLAMIRQLKTSKYKDLVECRIYNTQSPSFLLVDSKRAVIENLILGRNKKNFSGKLYGILPHLIFDSGDIRESLEKHFDYIWKYDSVPVEDFHENVEEKNYEINRLYLLSNLQKEIWDAQWNGKGGARSLSSVYDALFQTFKERLYPDLKPTRIIDLGCGDGGGGSLRLLKEYPSARITFVDISEKAISLFKDNAEFDGLNGPNAEWLVADMLTYLNRCQPGECSLFYANFSIIYMTKIKAVEIFKRIFNALENGGVFMLSVWTERYFDMPVGKHGQKGHRPPYTFRRVPMTENLQVLVDGPEKRRGEIRRFYRGLDELLEEFQEADEQHGMDFSRLHWEEDECGAVLRVWVQKKE